VRAGEGWWPLAPGQAAGRVVGGNLCTLNLLQGTEYMPFLDEALLMIEDDAASDAGTFCRAEIQALRRVWARAAS
jgi:muramoyltetrapeptide carboxypeptidase LdcA involved in peptidoglycan recycling